LYHSLIDVDRTKAAAGCGIIAATIPVVAVMLIVHGRLVYPIYGMRVETPEAAALTIMAAACTRSIFFWQSRPSS
jgi:hypothetical protein